MANPPKKVLTEAQKKDAADKRAAQKVAKFRELGSKRLTNAVKAVDNLARLANRNSYTWTPEQAETIMKHINASVEKLKTGLSATNGEKASAPVIQL